ncbi:MAG: 2-hydroxyglutaryl-CoA dehydratase [bacterium]|nr:2-hydroxyglutaryl-CoA dehydratase [bacterium]
MNYFAGIDSGSTTTEIVIIDNDNQIVNYQKELTRGDIQSAGKMVLNRALDELGCAYEDLAFTIGTGYGRKSVPDARQTVTEITCYAVGANFLDTGVRTVIDIGGQDSKVIRTDGNGKVQNFVMNDKCAAGTGKFLEMLANTFSVPIDALGELSAISHNTLKISSVCAVFAESEMISLFSRGIAKEDIIHAAHLAVCERVFGMLNRIGVQESVMFCGGVARNSGIVKGFENLLGIRLVLPEDVDRVGALGAALLAKRNTEN